jgi:hypothetical protein
MKQSFILREIQQELETHDTSLSSFGLPLPDSDLYTELNNRLIREQISTNTPGLYQPNKGELEEDIWPRIEEATFQMIDRGWADSCYQKEEIIRDSLLYILRKFNNKGRSTLRP